MIDRSAKRFVLSLSKDGNHTKTVHHPPRSREPPGDEDQSAITNCESFSPALGSPSIIGVDWVWTTSLARNDIKGLFLAHRHEVHAYLTRKLRDAETAADLTQETFLRYAEHTCGRLATVVTHQRSYLYRTAHNLAVDHMRREIRERTDALSDGEFGGIADDAPSPERTLGGRHDLAIVRSAILELPERTRQIFALARIEGLTYREVADRLQISDSSVQKHLAKATEHVMRRLRPR